MNYTNPITPEDIEQQLIKNIKEANYYIGAWFVIDNGD